MQITKVEKLRIVRNLEKTYQRLPYYKGNQIDG